MPPTIDDLRDAELAVQKALLEGDVDALDHLLDDESEWTGTNGILLTKSEQIEAHRSGSQRLDHFATDRLRVRVIGELGITVVIATTSGSTPAGPFTERVRCTRSWRLAEGHEEWQVIATHLVTINPEH